MRRPSYVTKERMIGANAQWIIGICMYIYSDIIVLPLAKLDSSMYLLL